MNNVKAYSAASATSPLASTRIARRKPAERGAARGGEEGDEGQGWDHGSNLIRKFEA